jgi:hypothetical protein
VTAGLPRPCRRALATGALLVVAAAATACAPKPGSARPTTTTAPTIAISPAATSTTTGATRPEPTAQRTPEGARSAAIAYLRLAEAVVELDDAGAAALQRAAASASAADGLVTSLLERLAAVRGAFPGGLAYRVAPLAAHVTSFTPERAVVEVWYVGVAVPTDATAYEEWRTARYQLVWERHGWRVAAESSTPGPRPSAPAQPAPVPGAALRPVLDPPGTAR